MSDYNRGAYTPPTDAPLSFDPRERPRGGGPSPVSLIVSVLVLLALIGAIVFFYLSGAQRGGGGEVEVGEPLGEIKQSATETAQPADPAAGLQIYRAEEGAAPPAQPNFVPPPEQPALRPTTPAPPPPAPVAVKPAPAAAPPAATTAAAAPKTATPPPAATATTPAPAAKTETAATPKAAPAAGGSAAVQIGALSSQALADAAWSEAARISPGGAAGKGKEVTKIERDGKTFYRTAVTGFASRADAAKFCDALKAAGKTCFVR